MPRLVTSTAGVARSAFLLTLGAGCVLIAYASLPYFFGDALHDFIVEKLPLPHEKLWMAALYVHVCAALFSLPACLVMLSRGLIRRQPRVHRILGRVTGGIVLLFLLPSGAWLALYAKGGAPGTAGFLLSGAIVAVAMIRGIAYARAGAFAAHRRCVLHVVGQLSVAVTSRALLVLFHYADVDPERAYLVALWLPVLASALAAALIGRDRRRQHATQPGGLVLDPAR